MLSRARLRHGRGRLARAALLAVALACTVSASGHAQFQLGERILSYGSWGADVFELQRALARIGYVLRSDGHFGKETERAVIAFQIANGLEPDGIVGDKTLAALSVARPFVVYTVREGDTLASVAEAFDAPVEDLKALNSVVDGPLEPGTVLQVPVRPTYTVRPGDTLSAIALRFGTTLRALVELNNIRNPDFILAGSVLRLPRGSEPTIPGF